MLRDPDFFGDEDLALLYIAKKLKEALRLEELLTQQNVEYAVEPDTYRGGLIFVSERIGAFFYVRPGDLESTRTILRSNGYRPYETK